MKKVNIKFSKNSIKKLSQVFVKYKVMIIIFYSFVIIIFAFRVVYEESYVKIKYSDYIESEDKVIANLKTANRLSIGIIEQINNKEDNFVKSREYNYISPFMYEKKIKIEKELIVEITQDNIQEQLDGIVIDEKSAMDFETIDQN